MFICLQKAHPWVLTPTSSTAKWNISSRRRWCAICVCVWEGGVGGVHSCIKWVWARGPFCHRQGLICQWRAVRSCGKVGTKVLKGCVTMRVLRGEPSSAGRRLPGTSFANHSAITFLCQSRGLVWAFMKRRKDTSSHSEVRVSLCFASSIELTRSSSWRMYINHLLSFLFDCGKPDKKTSC